MNPLGRLISKYTKRFSIFHILLLIGNAKKTKGNENKLQREALDNVRALAGGRIHVDKSKVAHKLFIIRIVWSNRTYLVLII